MKPQPSDLIGKKIQDVLIQLERQRLDFRILRIDEKKYSANYDCIFSRYNLEVSQNLVTKVWMG